MHDAQLGAPSPPPLPLMPSPPAPPPLHPPPSSSPSFHGFGTEDFLTQRVPLRPSQVITEQTTAVHAWLQEECARQNAKRRRVSGRGAGLRANARADWAGATDGYEEDMAADGGGSRESEGLEGNTVSLLAGTASMSRSDAAKAFYQALGAQCMLCMISCGHDDTFSRCSRLMTRQLRCLS